MSLPRMPIWTGEAATDCAASKYVPVTGSFEADDCIDCVVGQ